MSIKTSADEWVRTGPTRAIAVIAAVGLVIGGLIGVGAGYKIEQSRTRSDVKRLQAQLKAAAATGKDTRSGPLGQRVGKVTAVKTGSITVTTKKRGAQQITTTAATLISKAGKGSIADIVSGRRLLVTGDAHEILVLPRDSRIGRVVAKVGSDFFTIARPNGQTAARIKLVDVKAVSVAQPATAADLKTGVDVVAGGRETSSTVFNAVELVVLPANSGFAT
jgi:hypothetical protein